MDKNRKEQVSEFLKWIQDNGKQWSMVCTPDDGVTDTKDLKDLMKNLAKEERYELIFVTLMVHRCEPYIDELGRKFFQTLLLQQWENIGADVVGFLLVLMN